MNIVFADPGRCFGCKHCQWTCSFRKTGDFKTEDTNIWVNVDPEKMSIFTITCFQCDPAPCMEVCLRNALKRDRHTHAVVVDETRCIGCKLCMSACPFGMMHFDETRRVAAKCDTCQGEPQCVKFCLANALHYDDINTFVEMNKTYAGKKIPSIDV